VNDLITAVIFVVTGRCSRVSADEAQFSSSSIATQPLPTDAARHGDYRYSPTDNIFTPESDVLE
jgi:hypothetical protein